MPGRAYRDINSLPGREQSSCFLSYPSLRQIDLAVAATELPGHADSGQMFQPAHPVRLAKLTERREDLELPGADQRRPLSGRSDRIARRGLPAHQGLARAAEFTHKLAHFQMRWTDGFA